MVADEAGFVIVHEPEWTIVERQTKDRHVVRIHHPVSPADGLPLSDQPGGALDDFLKQFLVLVGRLFKNGKVVSNDIVGQCCELRMLPPIIEHLKGAEPNMRWSHP